MKEITNRKELNTMYSNLVYPDWTNKKKYVVLRKLDKDFVSKELQRLFNATNIANKYAILMPDLTVWYQHDFTTYQLIVMPI